MSTTAIGIVTSTINGDTSATPGTLVQRDGSGNIAAATITGTSLVTSGNEVGNVVTKSSSFTAGAATHYLCNATGGAITATLPLASANTGVHYLFVKSDSSGNAITLTSVSGTTSLSSQYAKATVFSDGSTWWSV